MRNVFRYANIYQKSMVIAISLMVIELIVELVQPVIMSKIVDEGIVAEDMSVIYGYGAILLGMTLFAFAAGIASSFFAAQVSQGVGHDMRQDMFRNIQMFSVMKIQQFATSTLLTRLTNDVTQVQGLLFAFMRIMLRAPLFIIFGIVISFTINIPLAFILLSTVPVLFIIMIFFMLKGMRLFRFVQEKMDRLNHIIRENLLAIKLVKVFHRIGFEKKRFIQVNTDVMNVNKKALWVMEIVMPIVHLVMNGAIIGLLWFGAIQLETGAHQAGELVAILNYATRILASFGVFSFLIMNLSRGRASAGRIDEVISAHPDDDATFKSIQGRLQGAVTFSEVDVQYPHANSFALEKVSFDVRPGQKVGILGETGAGKTSLLHLVPYLYSPTNGTIQIDGTSIEDWGNDIRRHVTLVPQEGFLFSGTIRENIAWGNEHLSEEQMIQVAKEAQLHDFIESLSDQYDTFVGQRGVNLSGGQKQRLSIARALAGHPSILLLDDSTSALDADTEKNVLQAIRQRACTTFIVSQKVSSIMDADMILLIENGKLVGKGNHTELLQSNPLYQAIWRSQQKEGGK
ncbi:ABC-type transport system ATP-binding/permease protein [Gracilibacillus halophilus YIM-C55.5]|uniref:ABC-type transport system ATP-binding/permease protein n=1 Tax=Gracilibacillus halophilus YIM-C55.5 TaxID=1308866 RepID=N4WBS5_9BACI|nr:ABC transporter ATP-binding protein [Gracilibacillus halophilus]ENH97753.1 ABC-type transport system ATP-binding/permease protein [Gracilibacillus halophilus YIM-C55.5]